MTSKFKCILNSEWRKKCIGLLIICFFSLFFCFFMYICTRLRVESSLKLLTSWIFFYSKYFVTDVGTYTLKSHSLKFSLFFLIYLKNMKIYGNHFSIKSTLLFVILQKETIVETWHFHSIHIIIAFSRLYWIVIVFFISLIINRH